MRRPVSSLLSSLPQPSFQEFPIPPTQGLTQKCFSLLQLVWLLSITSLPAGLP